MASASFLVASLIQGRVWMSWAREVLRAATSFSMLALASGEVLLDPVLGDGFAEVLIGEASAALPARSWLVLALQFVVEKVEVGLVEGAGEPGRVGVDDVQTEVALQLRQGARGEYLVEGLEEVRRDDVEAGELSRADRGEVGIPIKAGGELLERGDLGRVIAVEGIPQGGAAEGGFGEGSLDDEDIAGFGGGLFGGIAGEFEDGHHVIGELLADFYGPFIGLDVVVAVGQGQATLADDADLLGGVLEVLLGADGEEQTTEMAGLDVGDERCDPRLVVKSATFWSKGWMGSTPCWSARVVFIQAAKKSPYCFCSGVRAGLGWLAFSSSV